MLREGKGNLRFVIAGIIKKVKFKMLFIFLPWQAIRSQNRYLFNPCKDDIYIVSTLENVQNCKLFIIIIYYYSRPNSVQNFKMPWEGKIEAFIPWNHGKSSPLLCCMVWWWYDVFCSEQLMLTICNSRPEAKPGTLPHIEAANVMQFSSRDTSRAIARQCEK